MLRNSPKILSFHFFSVFFPLELMFIGLLCVLKAFKYMLNYTVLRISDHKCFYYYYYYYYYFVSVFPSPPLILSLILSLNFPLFFSLLPFLFYPFIFHFLLFLFPSFLIPYHLPYPSTSPPVSSPLIPPLYSLHPYSLNPILSLTSPPFPTASPPLLYPPHTHSTGHVVHPNADRLAPDLPNFYHT